MVKSIKKPFGIAMHSIFLCPLPCICMYTNSKFYFLFKKLQAYVNVQCLGSLFVISVSSICLVFVHNDFFIQLFFLFKTQHRYIKPQVLSSMTWMTLLIINTNHYCIIVKVFSFQHVFWYQQVMLVVMAQL